MGLRYYKSISSISTFFSQLRTSKDDLSKEGLYFISIWPSTDSAHALNFQDIVQDLVIPGLLKSDAVPLVWQLRNTSPAAKGGTAHNHFRPVKGGPFALAARLVDLNNATASGVLTGLLAGADSTYAQVIQISDTAKILGAEARTFQLVQRFEGKLGSKARGRCVIAVKIEPADGQAEDIELWYRKEYMAKILETPTFVRCTRYREVETFSRPEQEGIGKMACFLTLLECTSEEALFDYVLRNGPMVEETPWSKRLFATARSVERTVWKIGNRHVKPDGKVEVL